MSIHSHDIGFFSPFFSKFIYLLFLVWTVELLSIRTDQSPPELLFGVGTAISWSNAHGPLSLWLSMDNFLFQIIIFFDIQLKVTHFLWIIGSEKDIPFYYTYFRNKDHVNYIGEEESKFWISLVCIDFKKILLA